MGFRTVQEARGAVRKGATGLAIAAIADPLLLRVNRERDTQDVRDRRDSRR
jgi:hypothetical protein